MEIRGLGYLLLSAISSYEICRVNDCLVGYKTAVDLIRRSVRRKVIGLRHWTMSQVLGNVQKV